MQTTVFPPLDDGTPTEYVAALPELPWDALAHVCAAVSGALGIGLRVPDAPPVAVSAGTAAAEIARTSRVRSRAVALRGKWWESNSGPLLGFTRNGMPVALLPHAAGGYRMAGVSGPAVRVDRRTSDALQPTAYLFYRPFAESAQTARDLLMLALRMTRRDLGLLLVVGLAGGVLNMTIPLVTGAVFDSVIPMGDHQQLVVLGLVLVIGIVAIGLTNLICGLAVLRVEGRVEAALQPALFDRLLRLPASFFRAYASGDLADRVLGIGQIRLILSDSLTIALLSTIFALFNAFLLFAFDGLLGLLAIAIFAVVVLVTVRQGREQLRYQRAAAETHGEIAGLMLQIVNGIGKLRVAAAEERAYDQWQTRFLRERQLIYAARKVQNRTSVFTGVFPIVASMLLFGVVGASGRLSHGQFLAFNVAFLQVLFSGLHLASSTLTVLSAIPLYERLRPILETLPEVRAGHRDPGTLSGRIEVRGLTFRYRDDLPDVLQQLTLTINPGEFVAVVSASGGGKSTLVRLLLGFETPRAGEVCYDGVPLSELDVQAVRRQIGVVLQDGQVVAGSILSNIIGTNPLTEADAWEAARLAGLEETIRQMPMGLHTRVGEEGTTFSGGQRQQLLIARALATRPRLVIFDEATSALDDRAQAVVSAQLRELRCTRLIIAHRLSTVFHADRILFLEGGRVVETGTYAELMQRNGRFARLAKRQLV